MEHTLSAKDLYFWDAIELAKVCREYIDIFLKDAPGEKLRAFVDKVLKKNGENVLKLTSGQYIPATDIDHIVSGFDPEGGLDEIGCLCQ